MATSQLCKTDGNGRLLLGSSTGKVREARLCDSLNRLYCKSLQAIEQTNLIGSAGARTQDPRLKRPLLYRLSYTPFDLLMYGRISVLTRERRIEPGLWVENTG